MLLVVFVFFAICGSYRHMAASSHDLFVLINVARTSIIAMLRTVIDSVLNMSPAGLLFLC